MSPITGRFTAHTAAGRAYLIVIYTEGPAAGGHDDTHAAMPGLRTLLTERGERVTRLGRGHYRIVARGVDLFSDDPAAP